MSQSVNYMGVFLENKSYVEHSIHISVYGSFNLVGLGLFLLLMLFLTKNIRGVWTHKFLPVSGKSEIIQKKKLQSYVHILTKGWEIFWILRKCGHNYTTQTSDSILFLKIQNILADVRNAGDILESCFCSISGFAVNSNIIHFTNSFSEQRGMTMSDFFFLGNTPHCGCVSSFSLILSVW